MGVSLRRFHGWEPRTFTVRDGDRTITVPETEYDAWEQAIQAAYDDWVAGLCPDCGQPLTESLWDANADHHPTYLAGFTECRACEVLEITVNRQAQADQKQTERNNFPVPTRHRRWAVTRVDKPTE